MNKDLGTAIKTTRECLGISIEELIEKCGDFQNGNNHTDISNWENVESGRAEPTKEQLEAVAKIMGVEESFFFSLVLLQKTDEEQNPDLYNSTLNYICDKVASLVSDRQRLLAKENYFQGDYKTRGVNTLGQPSNIKENISACYDTAYADALKTLWLPVEKYKPVYQANVVLLTADGCVLIGKGFNVESKDILITHFMYIPNND